MNIFGWDTISVLKVDEVNKQFAANLGELVMSFDASWLDAFAGTFKAQGSFGPWTVTGGDGTDIYLTLPIANGTVSNANGTGTPADISGIAITLEVNLKWVPSSVTVQGHDLCFDLNAATAPGAAREPGDIYVKSTTDPNNTGMGAQLGNAIVTVLLANKDKITFIFAQTGIVDPNTATWLLPKQSIYSYHTPIGGSDGYLAIFSAVTDRDISTLTANIDSAMTSSGLPLVLAISGPLFLQYGILPVLPNAFPNTGPGNFSYSDNQITLAQGFDLNSLEEGAISYTPTMDQMAITIDANALRNAACGHCGLHMPNASMTFWAITNNVLQFDPSSQTFAFQSDPNPQTGSDSHVPWYDYLIGLGAIGAGIIALVLDGVEHGVSSALSGSALAGSLSTAPASTVRWPGLGQITVQNGELNDCLLLYANVS